MVGWLCVVHSERIALRDKRIIKSPADQLDCRAFPSYSRFPDYDPALLKGHFDRVTDFEAVLDQVEAAQPYERMLVPSVIPAPDVFEMHLSDVPAAIDGCYS